MEYKGLDAYTANVQQMFAKAGFTETPIGEYPIAEMFLYGTPLDVVFSVGSDVACGFHINDVLREQVRPFVVDKKWVGQINSEDFKCNTCGDVADFAYRLCRLCAPCLDDLTSSWEGEINYVHNNSEFDRTDVEVKRTMRKYFLKHATEDVSVGDTRPAQYAVEIVKPRVFDPPMKIKIVKAILAKQTPPK